MKIESTIALADAARERWDAVVIGAGPAGSAAALLLARRRLRVLIVDRAEFPRPKVCGCCLNARSLAALERLGLGDALRRLQPAPVEQLVLCAGNRRAILPLGPMAAISRERLDAALLENCIASGVHFIGGTAAVVEDSGADAMNHREFSCGTERSVRLVHGAELATIQSRIVIAADGLAGGSARKQLGGERISPNARIGAAAIADACGDSCPAGRLTMMTARGGYLGAVRLEDNRINFAAALDPAFVRESNGVAAAATSIMRANTFDAKLDLHSLHWRATPALTRRPRAVAVERLFALGDAAGYVEPFTGEGMAWALAGAEALAPLAADWKPSHAAAWTKLHAQKIRRRQRFCRAVAAASRHPHWAAAAVTLAAAAPQAARWLLDLAWGAHQPAKEAAVPHTVNL